MSGPLRRVREWWHRRRRGRGVLEPFSGPDDDPGGTGVREPRRPRPPQLEGGVALEEPRTDEGERA
ncbi:MAG TPA: hypothetical protein VFG75_00905 [Gaiella sp.]|nr:hypothetical protein [Gaiella sp.]